MRGLLFFNIFHKRDQVDFFTGSDDKLRTACQFCHKAMHSCGDFSRVEIAKLWVMVTERQAELMEAWNVYFND